MKRSKSEKRQQALERKAAHAKRTPQEQLALLDKRGMTATKERARLHALIEKGGK